MNKHSWTYKKLSEVCHPKKDIKRASKHYKSDDYISYIDISSIDNKNNVITETTRYAFCDAPSRAQQIVCSDDVIISMVRPNLKNIAMVREGSNLVASSGFCVLRSRPEVNPSFLFSFVKSTRFTNYLISRVSGANYPAVRESDIINFSIPVPSMEEQEAIVAELDEINEVIATLQQQVADLDALAQSTFYTMFGDSVTNPKGWEVIKMEEMCKFFSGYTPSQNLLSTQGKYPYFKVAEMNRQRNKVYLIETDQYIDNPQKIYPKGSIVFPKNGAAVSTNKKRILYQDSVVDLNTGGITLLSQMVNLVFLYYIMLSIDFQQIIRGGAIPTLDIAELKKRLIPIPPLALQQEFAAKVEAIESAKAEINAQIAEMQTLLASRMDYYFD